MSDTQPASPAVWVPPTTCAYLFQIEATTRSTNGYTYPIVYATDFQTVTLIKPTAPPIIRRKPGPTHVAMAGFHKLPESGDLARLTVKRLPKA
jgi:hypothetical protein